ncbi:MAG: hypothetical protein ACO3E1_12080 [Flavobacteriales bacterium]
MTVNENKNEESIVERHGPYALYDWFGQLAIKDLAENVWLVVNNNSLVFDLWKKIKRSKELPSHIDIENMEKGILEMSSNKTNETSPEKKMQYLRALPGNVRNLGQKIDQAELDAEREFQRAQWRTDQPGDDPEFLAKQKILNRFVHKYSKRKDLLNYLMSPDEEPQQEDISPIMEGIFQAETFNVWDSFEIQINETESVHTFVESVTSNGVILYSSPKLYSILNETFVLSEEGNMYDSMFEYLNDEFEQGNIDVSDEKKYIKNVLYILRGFIKTARPDLDSNDAEWLVNDLVEEMISRYNSQKYKRRNLHEESKEEMIKKIQSMIELQRELGNQKAVAELEGMLRQLSSGSSQAAVEGISKAARYSFDNSHPMWKEGYKAYMNGKKWQLRTASLGTPPGEKYLQGWREAERAVERMKEQGKMESEINEAEYRGRKVPLGKPMQGDVKKFKVYVKDPKTGNVKKVNFGDPNMRIKKSNPKRRKSFRARHNCDNPGPRTKARYWSCRKW